MSSTPWRAPPPSQSSQGQSFLPSGHHHPPNAVGNKQDSHGQGSYGNSMPHRPDQSRLPYSPFTCMNQGAVSNQYQNQPSNALPYNHFPPPLPPSASMAPPPPPPPPRPGSGHGIPPPFQPPSGYPSMPPPPQSNQFGAHGQPPPPPPFPVTPQQQQQSASTVMFNPAIPPPSHPPPLHPPPPHPSHPPPNPPQEEWSHDSSLSGPGQRNHRPVGNSFQPQSMQPNAHSQQAHVHGSSNRTQSRLQPYQSFRNKQSERNHQSSFPGKAQVQPGGDGLYDLEQGMSMTSEVEQPEKEESEDQKWVNEWSKSIQKRASVFKGVRRPIVKISEARMVLCRFLQLLNQLKKKKEDASDSLMKETDERKWFLLCKEMEKQVEDLSKLELKISQPEFVEGLKSQINKRRRKRERHRRHRQLEWEMREEELRKRNERIDASMAEALQAKQEKEQEEVLQKEVDQVLSEVHKKKQDANKTMELFRALRKLRQLRKESAEKRVGYKAPKVLDERFEKKMSSLEEMMNKQKLLYVEEERALQVMLEEEHEETREKARQKKEMKERQKAEKAWEKQLELLFGKTEELELGHPLFMFRQFHQQASHDLHSLTNIRRQWDMYLVPESDPAGSSIPVSWVMPSEPANHIWATSLADSAGS